MPFPNYPLPTDATNAMLQADEHPLRHNQVAAAANDLQDQIDEALLAASTQRVNASETTTSITYVNLATPGPAVTHTVPASGSVKVTLTAWIQSGVSGASLMTCELSGDNTLSATDFNANYGANIQGSAGATQVQSEKSTALVLTGLTPGPTVFTSKYRVTGGTGTFSRRQILVEDM